MDAVFVSGAGKLDLSLGGTVRTAKVLDINEVDSAARDQRNRGGPWSPVYVGY
jgi:hypothetical protein